MVTANDSTTICQGNTVLLTSSSTTGNTWSTGATTQSIPVTTSGTYSVTVSNGLCTATSAPVNVTVITNPSTPMISTSGSTTFCDGGSVTLTSSEVSGNVWSTGAATQSITVSTSGNYFVTVGPSGCQAQSQPVSVTVNSVPSQPVITAQPASTICEGGTAILTSFANSGNNWSTNETTNTITVSPALTTTYGLSVSTNGCTSDTAYFTVNVQSNPVAQASQTAYNELTAQQVVGATYQWIDCNNSGVTLQDNDEVFTATYNSAYAVVVDLNGCQDTSSCISISSIGIAEDVAKHIEIYPNPSNDFVQINSKEGHITEVQLISSEGKLIKSFPEQGQKVVLNVRDFEAGVYFLRIQLENGNEFIMDLQFY